MTTNENNNTNENQEIFKITNKKTNNTILIDSQSNFKKLNNTLDSITADIMRKKAEIELNPVKKRMMLKYADRWDILHTEGKI